MVARMVDILKRTIKFGFFLFLMMTVLATVYQSNKYNNDAEMLTYWGECKKKTKRQSRLTRGRFLAKKRLSNYQNSD